MDQPDFTRVETVVAELSDPKNLTVLQGTCKGLDKYFGLVGVESMAAILAGGLHNVFEHDPAIFTRMQHMLEAVARKSAEELTHYDLEMLASLLAEIIDKNDELRGEVNDILRKASWAAIARTRRRGESDIFTQAEDKRYDELLMREYSGIEAQLFDRLKNGIRVLVPDLTRPIRADVPDAPSADGKLNDVRPLEDQVAKFHHSANKTESDLLSWAEMQEVFKSDPEFLGGDWSKEPRKTLLWIWQNGTQEQWCAYVYNKADVIDDDLRSLFLEAFAADEERQIPTVWRTILIRALSHPRNAPPG